VQIVPRWQKTDLVVGLVYFFITPASSIPDVNAAAEAQPTPDSSSFDQQKTTVDRLTTDQRVETTEAPSSTSKMIESDYIRGTSKAQRSAAAAAANRRLMQ